MWKKKSFKRCPRQTAPEDCPSAPRHQAHGRRGAPRHEPRLRAAYPRNGRPSVAPERLLKALLLQSLYTIRSERELCRPLKTDLLFRWFLDMTPGEVVLHRSNPKPAPMHHTQQEFLSEHMPRYLDARDAAGIRSFALFGDDDLKAFLPDWLDLAAGRPGVFDLELGWHALEGGYWIRGNSFVPDYPFGLKDWCLRDLPDFTPVPTRRPVITTRDGVEEIAAPAAFFASRPTWANILPSLWPRRSRWTGASWCRTRRRLASGLACCTAAKMPAREPCHTARCGRTACHQTGQTLPRRLTTSIIEIDDSVGTPAVRVAWRREELSR